MLPIYSDFAFGQQIGQHFPDLVARWHMFKVSGDIGDETGLKNRPMALAEGVFSKSPFTDRGAYLMRRFGL